MTGPGWDDVPQAARRIHDVECDACRRDNYKYVMSCSKLQQILFDRAPDTAAAGAADELRARITADLRSFAGSSRTAWAEGVRDAAARVDLAAPPAPTTTDAAEGGAR